MPIFSSKRPKLKVSGREKPQEIAAYLRRGPRVYLGAADQTPAAQAPTAN